jgi:hypothetical protein
MKISKTHQKFSDLLKEPRALTNPEDYLGPNWEDVINFWLYIDTLSELQQLVIADSSFGLDYYVRVSHENTSYCLATEAVGKEIIYAARYASNSVTNWFFGWINYELIAHHKLLEQGKTLLFLPLCLKP